MLMSSTDTHMYVPVTWITEQLVAWQQQQYTSTSTLAASTAAMSASTSTSTSTSPVKRSISSTALIPAPAHATSLHDLLTRMQHASQHVTSRIDVMHDDMDVMRHRYAQHLIHTADAYQRHRYARMLVAWHVLTQARLARHHMYHQAVRITHHHHITSLQRHALLVWCTRARQRQRVRRVMRVIRTHVMRAQHGVLRRAWMRWQGDWSVRTQQQLQQQHVTYQQHVQSLQTQYQSHLNSLQSQLTASHTQQQQHLLRKCMSRLIQHNLASLHILLPRAKTAPQEGLRHAHQNTTYQTWRDDVAWATRM